MAIRIVRLGTPRAAAEGVRLNVDRCHRSILKDILREHGARIANENK